MDEIGMMMWMESVWAKRPGGRLRKPALLVCDQFKSPVTEATKRRVKDLNTQLAVIPGGLTSQLQPLDVSINKPFKAFLREEWMKWMNTPHHDLTPTEQMMQPTISQVCEWVKMSFLNYEGDTLCF
jgi:hypothetical protein